MNAHKRISALDVARSYIERGWNPVPVPYRSKKPPDDEWQKRIITHANVEQFFNGSPQNIGVVLGPASQGLTDVDLDCPEGIEIAPFLLPRTTIFGRPSSRAAHWLYKTELAQTAGKSTVQFRDPMTKAMLVEIRVGGDTGAQTIFPGSTHESGEAITWEEGGDPTIVESAELIKKVKLIAVGCLLGRYWPAQGARHDAALAVGGFMARAGHKPEWIQYFVERVARIAGCSDVADKKKSAYDSATNKIAGKKTYGLKTIADLFSKGVADKVAEWLEYDGGDAHEDAAATVAADDAIQIKDGDLHVLATKTEQLLIAAGVPLYQRGETLVRPIVETVDATRGRTTKVAQLQNSRRSISAGPHGSTHLLGKI